MTSQEEDCRFCNGRGTEADYVGLEMRCVEVECSMCGGTGKAPMPRPRIDDLTIWSKWRHLKTGGIYEFTGRCTIEATMTDAVLYRSVVTDNATVWCRPLAEFMDGRFEFIPAPPFNADALPDD